MVDENEWLCYYRCKLNEAEKKQHTNSSGFLLTGYFPAKVRESPENEKATGLRGSNTVEAIFDHHLSKTYRMIHI